MSRPLTVGWDTSLEAARVHFDILRKMGGAKRLAMGAELSNTLRSMVEAGVRHRHHVGLEGGLDRPQVASVQH